MRDQSGPLERLADTMSDVSGSRRSMYRWARLLGDVEAAEKGPNSYAKRVIRRRVYRSTNRSVPRALRSLHLF